MGLTIEDRGYNGDYGAPLWGDVALDFRSADQSRCLGSQARIPDSPLAALQWRRPVPSMPDVDEGRE